MLKVIYTETGQYLELLSTCAHEWVALQQILSRQAGRSLHTELCRASVLLPAHPHTMVLLDRLTDAERDGQLSWAIADADWVEVAFDGVWVSSNHSDEEGAFVACLGQTTAQTLCQLWMQAQSRISAMHP